ncbi:MAG: aminoacyl-tRNA hydrolase [Halothiobacillus sp.]
MAIQLVVGLGNPGNKYEGNRHNAGFWFCDALARRLNGRFATEAKFHGELFRVSMGALDRWIVKPQTYMNLSGKSVAAVANFYKIPPQDILVVHDELDLLPGKMKIKQGGGHGGHNGLKDIQAQLGSADFWRLRLGIGHPGDRAHVVGFVLTNPPASERQLIEGCIDHAVHHIEQLLNADLTQMIPLINGFTKP